MGRRRPAALRCAFALFAGCFSMGASSTASSSSETSSMRPDPSAVGAEPTAGVPAAEIGGYGPSRLRDVEAFGAYDAEAMNACASDDRKFLHMMKLSEELSFHWNLNVWSEHTPPHVTIKLQYNGDAWIAVGVSEAGMMLGSEAVIGRPALAAADHEQPLKYNLNAKDTTGVLPMEQAKQTLLDATITQSKSETVMVFTKLLEEDGELSINAAGHTCFIYAVGEGNILSKHRYSGAFNIDLSRCEPSHSTGTSPSAASTTTSTTLYKTAWAAHGTFATLAWAVATPFAVTTAWFRTLIPSSWIYIHVFANVAAFLLTLIAFIVAVVTTSVGGNAHFNKSHHIVGLVIFMLVTFQVMNGFLRPPLEKKDPYAIDHKGGERNGMLRSIFPETARELWHLAHRSAGLTLLGIGFWQISDGLNMFSSRFAVTNLAPLFYGYLILFGLLVVGLKSWMIYDERTAQREIENLSPDQRKMGSVAVAHGIDPDSELVPVQFDMQ